jgi:hypothetical protein
MPHLEVDVVKIRRRCSQDGAVTESSYRAPVCDPNRAQRLGSTRRRGAGTREGFDGPAFLNEDDDDGSSAPMIEMAVAV